MAHWWFEGSAGEWTATPLDGCDYYLSGDAWPPLEAAPATEHEVPQLPRLRQFASAGRERWFLLVPPASVVFVNGARLRLSIRQLRDQDEICLPGGEAASPGGEAGMGVRRFFFSRERLAQVVALPAGKPVYCCRCKDPIEQGAAAVRCPACGLWHHAMPERDCWGYAARCGNCDQPTVLDGELRWNPGQL